MAGLPILALGIFGLVYGLIAFRNVRGLKIPIWASMSFGAVLVLALQLISPQDALDAINFDVLVFLFGMFVLVAGLESSGLLSYMTLWLLQYVRSPSRLLWFIMIVFGVLSAFLINDTVALVGVPILIGIAKQMNMRVGPLLICLAFAVTIGSMMTPIGNPQNLLISLDSKIEFPFWTFLQYLALPTIVCLVSSVFILKKYYNKILASCTIPTISATKSTITNPTLAKHSSIITGVVMIGFLTVGLFKHVIPSFELNFAHVALAGGIALLILSKSRTKVIRQVNWQIIVFFVSMFVFMGAMWGSGAIDLISGVFPPLDTKNPESSIMGIILSSLGLSQIMSNVPFVAIYTGVMHNAGYSGLDVLPWIALAGASTLAGSLTILGAASNVIIIEAAEKRKSESFSFLEFFKIGLIITGTCVAILCAFLFLYLYILE